ncbi:glycosyltransferase family 2 protein [Nakamurella sp. PAMC28650]|jgi:glycosyltransferase involved in cell wall biosynthesis|uniref:glycosyltransferase family 2 protein n=1 Tax=Nakamurella sp. PAMC28650 TaxID=2762325 RepID=UPI001C9AB411|nr:glycosyltransferase family 2 protein [Nakamurella sp. PAMC28650]
MSAAHSEPTPPMNGSVVSNGGPEHRPSTPASTETSPRRPAPGVRLVVQVPCLNEEETIGLVLSSIPRQIDGVAEILVLIIDDGSTDRTVEVAKSHGVTHFVRHARNRGLGRSFHDGVQRALELGADIVVNTDGDNQYPQERIGDLVQPILRGEAEIVIADRQVHLVEHFSRTKKALQKFGSGVVNRAAGTKLPDAASGFRAYSRDSLMLLNTITRFSYCMETIIQAGNKKLKIVSIPIVTNPKTRESRLFGSMREHMMKSAGAIIRSYIMYKPYAIFSFFAAIFGLVGAFFFARYGILLLAGDRGGHLQSILVGAVSLIVAFLSVIIGITADLIRTNRMLIEDTLEHTKKMRFGRINEYVPLDESYGVGLDGGAVPLVTQRARAPR